MYLTSTNHATVVFSLSATDRIDTVEVSGSDRVMYVNQYEHLSIENVGIPNEFVLHDNTQTFQPNNANTIYLPFNGDAQLTIYNMIGQKVKQYSMRNISAGYHSLTWNVPMNRSSECWCYLYQLQYSAVSLLKNDLIKIRNTERHDSEYFLSYLANRKNPFRLRLN